MSFPTFPGTPYPVVYLYGTRAEREERRAAGEDIPPEHEGELVEDTEVSSLEVTSDEN